MPDSAITVASALLETLCQVAETTGHQEEPRPVPRPGELRDVGNVSAPITTSEEVRTKLTAWCNGQHIQGWLLCTDSLNSFDGAVEVPAHPLLAAELYRMADQRSLNLRHTPSGWSWEELAFEAADSAAHSFVEQSSQLVEPSRTASDAKRATYEVEWCLSAAPGDVPATFRPGRSRFIGWDNLGSSTSE